ncbi:MAG TPA: hypothetical protein VFQ85_03925 [Mycobacteriales bacterium]|jgi:hypothetical protein|nr:hypothetical protein [Mycobacteriales bacterium]
MSVITLPVGAPRLTLAPNAVAVPALSSHVRPALVLAERETRALLEAASRCDVRSGGRFASGPAGIQVWSAAFDGPGGAPGNAVHLGSVDWSYDTPVRHYATIYRAMVTASGVAAGETTTTVLQAVLGLCGIPMGGSCITMPAPPPRDPFRRLAV